MSYLLTSTADYDTPGSWGPASNGWPEIRGDCAYDMYVFVNMTGVIPYGSYVLMGQRGKYGATESMLRVHAKHLDQFRDDFLAAGQPSAEESLRRKQESGKDYAPKWW